MKKTTIALGFALAAIAASAFGASTINPNVPAPNSPLASGPIRSNFAAAYSDVNNILGAFAGTSAPANPVRFQSWMDTTTAPFTLKIYDGAQWVSTGKLNGSSHVWNPIGTYAGAPIGTAYGGLGGDFSAATGALFINSGTVSAGTLPAAFVPAPTLIALGGIKALGAVTHNFLTGLDTSGNLLAAQPACGDLSDGVSSCHVDTTNAANIGTGTLSHLRLPTPTLSTIGAVKAFGPTSHTFITTIGTDGSITGAQPACADVSDASAFCNGTNAASLTGTVNSARLSGSYTGITGLGTVTVGVWNGTAIANANLANSAVTVAGHAVSLGGSTTVASTDLSDTASIARSSNRLDFFSSTTSAQLQTKISNSVGANSLLFGEGKTAFTPSLQFNGAAVGMTGTFTGKYTVYGDAVTVWIHIALTAKGSSTGTAFVTGLPYTVANDNAQAGVECGPFGMAGTMTGGTAPYYANLATSNGFFRMNDAIGGNVTDANFTNTTDISFSCTYLK